MTSGPNATPNVAPVTVPTKHTNGPVAIRHASARNELLSARASTSHDEHTRPLTENTSASAGYGWPQRAHFVSAASATLPPAPPITARRGGGHLDGSAARP